MEIGLKKINICYESSGLECDTNIPCGLAD